jgi:hypothetical protein
VGIGGWLDYATHNPWLIILDKLTVAETKKRSRLGTFGRTT